VRVDDVSDTDDSADGPRANSTSRFDASKARVAWGKDTKKQTDITKITGTVDAIMDHIVNRPQSLLDKALAKLVYNARTPAAVAPNVQGQLDALAQSFEINQQRLASMEQKLDAVLAALTK
jgi:hypothetical protein